MLVGSIAVMKFRRAEATFSSFVACSFLFSVEPSNNALPHAAPIILASPALALNIGYQSFRMYFHQFLSVFISFALFTLTSAHVPEYATRVNSAFRYPIPYPTPTNQYNTHTISSSPISVTQDWSTPSDYSLWILQTDNYKPSLSDTSIALLNTLVGSTMSVPELNSESSVSSMLKSSMSMKAMTAAPAEGIATDLPKLSPTRPNEEITSTTASTVLPSQSTGAAGSHRSVAAVLICAMAAAALDIAALL